jgi:hypothetical protein
MTSDGFTSHWLFRLLDYEHYDVRHNGELTGMVVINHADRSVTTRGYDEDSDVAHLVGEHAYNWWRKWLREHEEPLLP